MRTGGSRPKGWVVLLKRCCGASAAELVLTQAGVREPREGTGRRRRVPLGRVALLPRLLLFAVYRGLDTEPVGCRGLRGRPAGGRAALRWLTPGAGRRLGPPLVPAPRRVRGRPPSPPRLAMAGALSGMFANQPPGPPPPPGPPGGPGPAGLIPPPTGPRNPNNTLVDELEASFEVCGPRWRRPRAGAGFTAPAPRSPLTSPLRSLAGLLRLAGEPGLRERHGPGGDPHR